MSGYASLHTEVFNVENVFDSYICDIDSILEMMILMYIYLIFQSLCIIHNYLYKKHYSSKLSSIRIGIPLSLTPIRKNSWILFAFFYVSDSKLKGEQHLLPN